ncbi:MAG: metal-dependent transcriptional regulator [Bacillota bacterium]|nr:metal-dependent transcriptional regulator [Bacillota bacterium]
MKILESAENYLESILILKKEKGNVRSIDVVNYLGFSKPSVSVAMKQLEANGFITRDKDGLINLTEEGKQIAENIYEKHALLTRHFISIGVSAETAREDACRIEHYISQETFDALKRHHMNKHE